MTHANSLTIGKVVQKLKPNYPDLTISKVRYLEDEGLLHPLRSPSGYRLYSQRDVKLLEDVLYLQKNHFMPLGVIKKKLLGCEAAVPSADVLDSEAAQQYIDAAKRHRLYPIDRLPEVAQVSISFARELCNVGLIHFKKSPQGRDLVDARDIPLIQTADRLRHFGIGPKNLRQYVIAANRERSMFEHALVVFSAKAGGVTPQQTKERQEAFDEAFHEILTLTNTVRTTLITRHIQQTFHPEDTTE
jgi:hypothetical protein